jgi:purine-binding chemotaxis protein CheW
VNATATAARPAVDEHAVDARQYLVFSLGGEEYAIDILKVQEIRDYEHVTRVSGAPPFIKGVANLRGLIVPIVDLRLKFGLTQVGYDGQTVVIVINLGARVVGVVVDRVSDVVTLAPGQTKPAPEFGVGLPLEYVDGLGDLGERMLILVAIEKLLLSPEMALVDAPQTA